jgi:hypothetical protein
MTSVPLEVQALRDFPTVTGGVSEGGDMLCWLMLTRGFAAADDSRGLAR